MQTQTTEHGACCRQHVMTLLDTAVVTAANLDEISYWLTRLRICTVHAFFMQST